ncbi:MAG: GHKL domain-containing protein [Clostridiales bacterium]
MELLNYPITGLVVSISLLIYYINFSKNKLRFFLKSIFCSTVILSVIIFEKDFRWIITFDILLLLFYKYENKFSLKQSVVYTVITSISFIVNENIVKTLIIILGNFNDMFFLKMVIYSSLWIGSASIFSRLLKRLLNFCLTVNFNIRLHYYSVVIVFTSFSLVITSGIISNYYLETVIGNTKFYIFNVVVFLIIILTSIALSVIYIRYSINNRILEEKNKELANIEEYAKNIELFYSKIKVFKHDYKNILLSIDYYLQENKIDELKKYFRDNIVNQDSIFEEYNFLISLKYITSISLKGLISSKLIKAASLGINLEVSINETIDENEIDELDKIRIFGNLLDNSIESAVVTEQKNISIIIYKEEGTFTYIIKNSCTKEMPPIHKILNKGFSTKKNNSGIGLSSVKDIIGKYTFCYMDIFINSCNNTFNVEIMVKNS